MWAPISERFDCIVANPPFLPIPADLEYPPTTNGGADGLRQVARVLSGLKSHLNDSGIFFMVGECMGAFDRPLLLGLLDGLAGEGFRIDLVLISREIASFIAYLLGEVASHVVGRGPHELAELFKENFSRHGANYYYHYFLRAMKVDEGEINVVKLHGDWTPEDVPKRVQAHTKVDAFILGGLSEMHRKVFEKCDERQSVREIARQLFGDLGEPAAVRALQRALNYCDDLEALGFVERRRLALH